MTITPILVFVLAALLIGWAIPARWRVLFMLAASLLSVYWLQPGLPIRNLDFWLPTTSILLTLFVWAITKHNQTSKIAENKAWLAGLAVITVTILAIGLTRYMGPACCLTPSRPPDLLRIILFLAAGGLLALVPLFFKPARKLFSSLAILLIIALLVVLKSPAMLQFASAGLRSLTGQPANLATSQDVIWLGFSFLAFRLLHVLFDFRAGRIPDYRLDEFVTYVLFFPSLPAGPIDRSQRFIIDLHQPPGDRAQNRFEGSKRIVLGLFKKFVLADSLALIALSSQNASQVGSPFWMWLLVYAYALRIYFDFSGYTDVALGLGKYLGINLPENFNQPYLKTNLTAFWNSWHITLAQWFRAYTFNPLTRYLRSRPNKLPVWLIILTGQVSTMLLIGLWHGITWNYAIWGLWHAAGLFIHNRWTEWRRSRSAEPPRTWLQRASGFAGWVITFNYVCLGWVWFALPDVKLSWQVILKLFGV